MKRFFFLFALMVMATVNATAEKLPFRTTSVSFATIDDYGTYHWGDWEKCNVRVTIDTDDDIVTIYSKEKQVYYIYDTYNDGDPVSDGQGGEIIKFFIVDQDSDEGEMRLRIDSDGDTQLYIDFENCAWVYNIVAL